METATHRIQICMGSSCFARGNGLNAELLQMMKADGKLDAVVDGVSGSLCAGLCKDGPIVVVDGTVHKQVTPTTLQDILSARFKYEAEGAR